ncbi:DUF4097 family beta strand repeat-containing protein [Streptomyces sp. NPDC006739]|uniref:DUF4097 family beta strand repeat-containing protein n=1 Tax=Streptomyces sp. NPDC006739 TaxID=3364763 RepID=UPI0036C853C1
MQKNQSTVQKFDTDATITAVVDIPIGHIRFVAADGAGASVEVLPSDPSKSRDVKAAEQVTVSYDNGVLRVESPAERKRMLGHPGSLEVTVQLPAGSRVDAKASVAEVSGVGRLGDVTFEGAQGTVKLDETGGARLTLATGDITVGRLNGPAEVSTQKGDLSIAEAVQGTVTLTTQHGQISIGAAQGVSATLDASTGYGRIDNALKNSDGAGAGLNIHATTSYGSITARSL